MSHSLDARGRGGDEDEVERVAPGRSTVTARLIPPAVCILRFESGERGGDRDGNGVAAGADAAVARATSSAGSPLPASIQRMFESSTRADLSGVRVHTGAESAGAARAVGAKAYAVGQDIHFGQGQYAPADPFGLHLLAHEVAHTVQQQGGGPRRQAKMEVSAPGDAAEVEADRAADAMVSGAPAAIGGAAAQVARAPDAPAPAGAAPAAAGDPRAAAGFVTFTSDGNWNGQEVLDNLSKQGTVPADLKAAILAGPKPTAQCIVGLRGRVQAALGKDPSKKADCDRICNALSERVNELANATPQSPTTYGQLAEVATLAGQYPAAGGAAAATAAPAAGAADQPAGQGQAAAVAYATKLASDPGARPPAADGKDVVRGQTKTAANQDHKGDESGNAELANWTFRRDPFDNTVVALRPNPTDDDAGFQFTFKVGPDGGGATLVNTVKLSKLRAAALQQQDAMANIKDQESEAGRTGRLQRDTDATARDRKYDADHAAWVAAGDKSKPEPEQPKGYQSGDHRTTDCTMTPGEVFNAAAAGDSIGSFSFTPPTTESSWHGFAPGALPKPGDVYWLYDTEKHQTAHMGVFKSASPAPGDDPSLLIWTVTDGGQGGGYEQIQQEEERTRGPYNPQTGLFSSSLADAGQTSGKGNRKLTGWIDIDAYKAAHPKKK